MEIKTAELLKVLNTIKSGLSKKEIMQGGKTFIFTGTELLTYNDQISIRVPYKTDFAMAVPSDELLKILSKIKTETIQISFDIEKTEFSIKSGRTQSGLKCPDIAIESVLEVITPDESAKWKNLPDDFIQGLLMTLFSASSDMTKPILTCISVGKEFMLSSDNLRISKYGFTDRGVSEPFLLPALSAQEIIKIKTLTKYTIDGSWIHFAGADGLIFSSRTVDGEFPDVSQFFEIEGEVLKLPQKELQESIEMVSILAEGDFDFDKKIEVEIKDKKIICTGVQDVGWISDSIDCHTSKEIKFYINPFYFKEILNHPVTAVHSEKVLKFISGTFQHLVSLF